MSFQEKFSDSNVGFSKFCVLCPKWCKTIGCSGSHSVCVCAIHQNTILACQALNLDYKDLTNKGCVWYIVVLIVQENTLF